MYVLFPVENYSQATPCCQFDLMTTLDITI